MIEKNLIYSIKVPVDFTCRPGGGIDVHYIVLEFPEGTSVKSAPSMALNCWPLLPTNVLVPTITRTIDRADAPVARFAIPEEDTAAGEDLGYVKAEYQDSLYSVKYDPYVGDKIVEQQALATKTIQRLTCQDGARPVARADGLGNITYVCRDGSEPVTSTEIIRDTGGSPLGLPHYDITSVVEQVELPRVEVTSQERWMNIPLAAIGCCSSSTTVEPTTTADPTTTTTAGPTLEPTL